jgi:hypothetical protein
MSAAILPSASCGGASTAVVAVRQDELQRDGAQLVGSVKRSAVPALISGGCAAWAPGTVAALAHLAANPPTSERQLRVACSGNSRFCGTAEASEHVLLRLGALWQHVRAHGTSADHLGATGLTYYLSQCCVDAGAGRGGGGQAHVELPELASALVWPQLWCDSAARREANLWACAGAVESTAHYDADDNVLAVLVGRKIVALASPAASGAVMGVYPLYSLSANHAAADLFAPLDSALGEASVAGPAATAAARPVTTHSFGRSGGSVEITYVTVAAGDALYIPEGWWHAVRSDAGTVAVNFWFVGSRAGVSDCAPPHQQTYLARSLLHAAMIRCLDARRAATCAAARRLLRTAAAQPGGGEVAAVARAASPWLDDGIGGPDATQRTEMAAASDDAQGIAGSATHSGQIGAVAAAIERLVAVSLVARAGADAFVAAVAPSGDAAQKLDADGSRPRKRARPGAWPDAPSARLAGGAASIVDAALCALPGPASVLLLAQLLPQGPAEAGAEATQATQAAQAPCAQGPAEATQATQAPSASLGQAQLDGVQGVAAPGASGERNAECRQPPVAALIMHALSAATLDVLSEAWDRLTPGPGCDTVQGAGSAGGAAEGTASTAVLASHAHMESFFQRLWQAAAELPAAQGVPEQDRDPGPGRSFEARILAAKETAARAALAEAMAELAGVPVTLGSAPATEE